MPRPRPTASSAAADQEPAVRPPVVLVTGGAQGIGRGICGRFLAGGWRVVCLDRDAEALAATRRELSAEQLLTVTADVSRPPAVARAVARALAWGGRLDCLVANAGIEGERVPLHALTLAQWQRVIATDLTGVLVCAQAAAPHLAAVRGSIVTIASTRATMSEPNTFAYTAAKGGVVALTHALAVSLGPAVRANCISPGWIAVEALQAPPRRREPQLRPIDHAQHPAGRVGKAEDIAALAWFLASPEAGFLTGAHIPCDGGMTRKMIYAEE